MSLLLVPLRLLAKLAKLDPCGEEEKGRDVDGETDGGIGKEKEREREEKEREREKRKADGDGDGDGDGR